MIDNKSDDMRLRVADFMKSIAAAKIMNGVGSDIEADQDIIDYFNPGGLNGAQYFIYEGIKVFPKNKAQSIKAEIEKPLEYVLHGKQAASWDGR